MKIKFLLSFFTLLTIFSCTQGVFISYGEDINGDAQFYDTIDDNLDISNVSGEILDVCPKKGCWMNVKVNTDTVFVKFKDYGFFVPKTGIQGKKVLISGEIFKDTISVERLKHYAEDAKKSKTEIDLITEPEYKINMIATGVAIEEN
tara:strand:- start:1210 stop:1650 length:441 start_codon:yes stop_codon:yes gene_type:complete